MQTFLDEAFFSFHVWTKERWCLAMRWRACSRQQIIWKSADKDRGCSVLPERNQLSGLNLSWQHNQQLMPLAKSDHIVLTFFKGFCKTWSPLTPRFKLRTACVCEESTASAMFQKGRSGVNLKLTLLLFRSRNCAWICQERVCGSLWTLAVRWMCKNSSVVEGASEVLFGGGAGGGFQSFTAKHTSCTVYHHNDVERCWKPQAFKQYQTNSWGSISIFDQRESARKWCVWVLFSIPPSIGDFR